MGHQVVTVSIDTHTHTYERHGDLGYAKFDARKVFNAIEGAA